jgi:predicted nucleic acid-binding protein
VIVVDTSVLSLAYRRPRATQPESPAVALFREAVKRDVPVLVPGIVSQELMSGLRSRSALLRMAGLLRAFAMPAVDFEIHIKAARIHATCQRRGLAASTIDCLIAAHALNLGAALLTVDRDFQRMAEACPLRIIPVVDS